MADVSRLPGPNSDFWDWQLLAACRGEDPGSFFHPDGSAARPVRPGRKPPRLFVPLARLWPSALLMHSGSGSPMAFGVGCRRRTANTSTPGALLLRDLLDLKPRTKLMGVAHKRGAHNLFGSSGCGRGRRGRRGRRLYQLAAPRAFPPLVLRWLTASLRWKLHFEAPTGSP